MINDVYKAASARINGLQQSSPVTGTTKISSSTKIGWIDEDDLVGGMTITADEHNSDMLPLNRATSKKKSGSIQLQTELTFKTVTRQTTASVLSSQVRKVHHR